MINKYISTENEIFKEYLNKRIIKNFDQKYSAVIKNVNRDLNQSKKTLLFDEIVFGARVFFDSVLGPIGII